MAENYSRPLPEDGEGADLIFPEITPAVSTGDMTGLIPSATNLNGANSYEEVYPYIPNPHVNPDDYTIQ